MKLQGNEKMLKARSGTAEEVIGHTVWVPLGYDHPRCFVRIGTEKLHVAAAEDNAMDGESHLAFLLG